MVCGFLGAVISLERAVALGRPWTYAAPLFSVVGALVLLTTLAPFLGALLMTLHRVSIVGTLFLCAPSVSSVVQPYVYIAITLSIARAHTLQNLSSRVNMMQFSCGR